MEQITLQVADERTLYFQGNIDQWKNRISKISQYNRSKKRYEIPVESLEDARSLVAVIKVSDEADKMHQLLKRRHTEALAMKNRSEEEFEPLKIKGLKANLYPYQNAGVHFLDTLQNKEGAILAFDMGLGKSLTSLATFMKWKQEGIVDHCLIVCPAPLKRATWEKEVKKWTGLDITVVDGSRTVEVEWDDGTTEKRRGKKLREVQYQQWSFGSDVIIVNYELFRMDGEFIEKMNINDRWCVILDECHRIKNPRAKTTKALRKLLAPAGRKILGSGTPLENNAVELWSTIDFCRPNLLGSYYKFLDRYVVTDYYGTPQGLLPNMVNDLKTKIAPVILRKTKEEALPDLPPLTVQEYWVDLTKEQKKLYKEIAEGILLNAKTEEYTYMEALAALTRIQQVCDSPALLRELAGNPDLPIGSGKLKELKSIIEDLNPRLNKFILFSQYRQMTDILVQWLVDEKILPKKQIGYIKGGMKPDQTMKIQQGFQEGNIQCIVMTTAGNYGLDLSSGSYVIAYDQLFNPQKMEQIYARCHRNGVKSAVTAINLVTRGTYEEKKLTILEDKRDLFKQMIDSDVNDGQFAGKLFSDPKDIFDLI